MTSSHIGSNGIQLTGVRVLLRRCSTIQHPSTMILKKRSTLEGHIYLSFKKLLLYSRHGDGVMSTFMKNYPFSPSSLPSANPSLPGRVPFSFSPLSSLHGPVSVSYLYWSSHFSPRLLSNLVHLWKKSKVNPVCVLVDDKIIVILPGASLTIILKTYYFFGE